MMKSQHTDVYLASLSEGHPGHGPHSPGFGHDRSMRPFREIATRGPGQGRGRFVTQSHVLSAPLARPASLAIAAAVAVALVLVTRRLTH